MYLGGIQVMADRSNADRLALAAHAFRELMGQLANLYSGVERLTPMGEKVSLFQKQWEKARARSVCHADGEWKGSIDDALSRFLVHCRQFFDWHASSFPRRRERVGETLQRLDRSPIRLPRVLTELSVAAWSSIYDYWNRVAHHNVEPGEDEFLEWVASLERFLLDRLIPRTFEDLSEIDALISGGAE